MVKALKKSALTIFLWAHEPINEKSIQLQDVFSLCKFWLALTVT